MPNVSVGPFVLGIDQAEVHAMMKRKFLKSNEIIRIPDNLQQAFTRVVHSRGFEGLFILKQDVFFEVPDKMCGVVATSDIKQALKKINNKYHQADYNELEGEWYVYFE